MMNRVYYIVGKLLEKTGVGVVGGHGYCYDINNPGKKKVQKDVATVYGYFVNNDHQTESVNIDHYLSGRSSASGIQLAFLHHLEAILSQHIESGGGRLLIATSMPKLTKGFTAGNAFKDVDKEVFNRVYKLYEEHKSAVIFDLGLFPKGGLGCKHATNQLRIAEMLTSFGENETTVLNKLSEKEFNNPEVDLNPIITASRWYFNTGDTSQFYDLDENGCRHYYFGRVEPDKNYYGKATPDVYYSILVTKKPLSLLDKVYDFCKANKDNELNRIFAGNLNNIKSKEVSKTINDIIGQFKGNELISPMKIGSVDEPSIVEHLNPPGLAYRITGFMGHLEDIYAAFKKRDDRPEIKRTKFMDITDYFLEKTDKKVKISPEFTAQTLKFNIPIEAPGCVMPVKIGLSISYDCPSRNAFAGLLKEKIEDIKVWLMLNFNDPAGVSFCTIVTTPEFDYIHSNAASNLRVYSLRELGRKKPTL